MACDHLVAACVTKSLCPHARQHVTARANGFRVTHVTASANLEQYLCDYLPPLRLCQQFLYDLLFFNGISTLDRLEWFWE